MSQELPKHQAMDYADMIEATYLDTNEERADFWKAQASHAEFMLAELAQR